MLDQLKARFGTRTYDRLYQNIEVLGVIGYDNSAPTWEKIQSLPLSWENQIVCDLGCFHGYFSLKVKEAGAQRVIGLDHSDDILETAKLIAQCSEKDIEFQKWIGGEKTPICDTALVLNMLHHCENQSQTLENIQCKNAIFEVNRNQLSIIDSVFRIQTMKEGRSYPDRESRLMIYAEKK